MMVVPMTATAAAWKKMFALRVDYAARKPGPTFPTRSSHRHGQNTWRLACSALITAQRSASTSFLSVFDRKLRGAVAKAPIARREAVRDAGTEHAL